MIGLSKQTQINYRPSLRRAGATVEHQIKSSFEIKIGLNQPFFFIESCEAPISIHNNAVCIWRPKLILPPLGRPSLLLSIDPTVFIQFISTWNKISVYDSEKKISIHFKFLFTVQPPLCPSSKFVASVSPCRAYTTSFRDGSLAMGNGTAAYAAVRQNSQSETDHQVCLQWTVPFDQYLQFRTTSPRIYSNVTRILSQHEI